MAHTTTPSTRGCGARDQDNALYLCVGLGPAGRPIEDCVIDPAKAWEGGPFRSPMLLPRKDGINDVAIWIGAEHYPSIGDYVEESRRLGISRRIPITFPMDQLTPMSSRMILIHAKAIPNFVYLTSPNGMCRKPEVEHLCTFDNWALGALLPDNPHRHALLDTEDNMVHITLPSFGYNVRLPELPRVGDPMPYHAGAFAAFYITHLEYIAKSRKTKLSPLPAKIRHLGWEVETMEQ